VLCSNRELDGILEDAGCTCAQATLVGFLAIFSSDRQGLHHGRLPATAFAIFTIYFGQLLLFEI
jgi:hypothetical protein